ncbi:uncharacterized protein C2845_PM01G13380 [Panicum miliaceum]|uniref:VQ domain-containing protein n=1 Tax=Panicum miliaceum TaxID=4540 RepID=A0A3L6TQJ4_PANMI|nr:uncharacterized protein C2845_PM01G13380 [Panicum miliaceum]
MDGKLGVHHGHHHHGISKPPVHHHHHGGKRGAGRHAGSGSGGGGSNKGIKVVYISSPMKLTASAEEFRAVVQELTGRDSNVADHDLAGAYYAGAPSSSSSSSSSYASFGRVSPTGPGAAGGARALSSPTMATGASVGAGRAAEYGAAMAAPPPFQGVYDHTAGSLLYGQDYYW